MDTVNILITEDGLFSKWIGAELVNAIDTRNNHLIASILRNRRTLTTVIFSDNPEIVEVFVEALGPQDRDVIAIFQIPKKIWNYDDQSESDKETLNRLSDVVHRNPIQIALAWEEDTLKETKEEVKEEAANKAMN